MAAILIFGASVRAAAASALRGGLEPWCVDLFGDLDLANECEVRVVDYGSYPDGLVAALDEGPPGPWMYTGGLENAPWLLTSERRPLWGNGREVVERVRDPFKLSELLPGFPAVRHEAPFTRDSSWLVKPLRSSGGMGVFDWSAGRRLPRDFYLQRRVEGIPASAVFSGVEGKAVLLGVTQQLVGCDWLHVPRPYQYAGSIGLLNGFDEAFQRIGDILVERFKLRGLFGVDAIIDKETVRPIEVNPRYPASFEILERAWREPLFEAHVTAFSPTRSSRRLPFSATPTRIHGKAIYYAAHNLVIPAQPPWSAALEKPLSSLDVEFADIPRTGQSIALGQPVVTIFADGVSFEDCEMRLRQCARQFDEALAHASPQR